MLGVNTGFQQHWIIPSENSATWHDRSERGFCCQVRDFKFSELTDCSLACGKQKVLPPRFRHRSLPLGSRKANGRQRDTRPYVGGMQKSLAQQNKRHLPRPRVHRVLGPLGLLLSRGWVSNRGSAKSRIRFLTWTTPQSSRAGTLQCSELGVCWEVRCWMR